MSELAVGSFRDRVLELEKKRLGDLKALPTEERLSLLEAEVSNEMDILYNKVLPELDEQISRTLHEAYSIGDRAREHHDASVQEIRTTKHELEQGIRQTLNATVNELIRRSDSSVVAEALHEALRSTILKVRPATREEARSKDTLVVRTASPAEIREQQ
jgi:hypothetical protein